MGDHLTEKHLKKLTSHIMYSYFEDGQSGCTDIPFYSTIKEELQKQNYQIYNLHNISDKILKALCFIYNRKKHRRENFDEELCWYFYYWLGDKIYSLVQDKRVVSRIINMIYDELNSNIRENFIVCRNHYSPIDKDRFINNKILFDYSKDYVNIRIHTAPGNTTCDNVYKKYLAKYIEIYNDAYIACNQRNHEKYDCDKFSSIFDTKLYNELSTFNCREHQNVVQPPEMPRVPEGKETMQVHNFSHSEVRDSPRHQSISGGLDLNRNIYSSVQQNHEIIETLTMDNATESGTSKTIAGSVAPVLGVSSISLLLYKVTPVGGYINRLLGRNRNMYNHIEYMDAFNPYSEGMVPGDRRMNIFYNRL